MMSTRASSSAMPSPTFAYATTYSVPRSSPMLSSSCTPFYPRSQQQIYYSQPDPSGNYGAGCFASPHFHESHPYEWHYLRDPKFYDQQCYTSTGSDPYKFSSEGNLWGGCGWQSGNSVPEEYAYADDEADYVHSDSLSYYGESPCMEQEFYACPTSTTSSLPALYPDPGATAFNVPHSSAKLQQASCFSKDKEHVAPSLKSSFVQDQSVPYCAFAMQGPAKSMSNEGANAFSVGKLNARPFLAQVSSQMCTSFGITSPVVEPKMMQATKDMTETKCASTDSSKPSKASRCNFSDEHGLPEAIKLKLSIQATSNSMNTLKLLEGNDLDVPTMPISAELNQKEADHTDSLSLQDSSCQLRSTSGQCSDTPIPNPINAQTHYSSVIQAASVEQRDMGSLSSRLSPVMEMEGKPCVEAIDHEAMHQDTMGSSYSPPENAWLSLNGPQLLVKCIHNLSKVLLSSQSGTLFNVLDPMDYFAIENTICILSHRLSESSLNEGNLCQDQNCHQVAGQNANISDAKLNEEAGSEILQQKSSFLLEGTKHKLKIVRVLENEALVGSSKVTASTVDEDERVDQRLFRKKEFKKPLKDLQMLQCYVTKLQEEVAYECAESNATVANYNRLWSEAQEALKVSRSEIKEFRSELTSLKQDFTNLKHSEGSGGIGGMSTDIELTKYDMKTSCINQEGSCENLSDVKTGSSQTITTQDVQSASNADKKSAFGRSFKASFTACGEVVTDYFVPANLSNCREKGTPYAKGEMTLARHNNQSGKRFEISPSEPASNHVGRGTNLEAEVTRRLSLLRSRQGLDVDKTGTDRNVDKTGTDRNVELHLGFSTIEEASSHLPLPKEGEAMPPDIRRNHLIWTERSHMVNAKVEIGRGGGVEADLGCRMNPAFEAKHGDSSVVRRQSDTRNSEVMGVDDVNVSTCEEDDIEIICLKPGVAESSYTCLKGEPEWEDVVVNLLDDQNSSRQGNYPTPRRDGQ